MSAEESPAGIDATLGCEVESADSREEPDPAASDFFVISRRERSECELKPTDWNGGTHYRLTAFDCESSWAYARTDSAPAAWRAR